ncbi:MAG: ABC transporter permease [Chitinispirillaceae bacterium]|nr:ABC transporter permease [Chitinispirillaceae bacterium]
MRRNAGPLYVAPLALWLCCFFIVPLGIIALYSFMSKGVYGGVVHRFSFGGYTALFNPLFLTVTLTTFLIAASSSVITVLLALPAAYFIARSARKNLWLFLVIIPFWTNFLIRIYAWIAILGNNGFLNSLLLATGITSHHLQFLYNKYAVLLVTVYTYLPFAILPLYSTIEKFDFSLLEAARDLGATVSQSIFRVLIPSIRGGITTAILFTFIPAFGSYAIPQILGGSDSLMLGNIIARELTVTRNWPLASSIAMVLTVVTTFGVVLFIRLNRFQTVTTAPEAFTAGGVDGDEQ